MGKILEMVIPISFFIQIDVAGRNDLYICIQTSCRNYKQFTIHLNIG